MRTHTTNSLWLGSAYGFVHEADAHYSLSLPTFDEVEFSFVHVTILGREKP